MEELDFKKDFLDYDWLKKGNIEVRSQNNRTIMYSYLKIEQPDFETLKEWISKQQNKKSEKSKNESSKHVKISKNNHENIEFTNVYQVNGETSGRFIYDKSPSVKFKSKKLKECIKISRYNLILKLMEEMSSKTSFRSFDNLSLFGGLRNITNDLSFAIGGTNIVDNVDPLNVRVMFLLNQYILKNNININTKEYALLRGLMHDVLLVQSNQIKLRASLNTFHIMSILGFDYLFDIDSFCLYLEALIKTISTGIKSYIEKFWRVVHGFSNIRNPKEIICNEISNCKNKSQWVTSLEEVYSIIVFLHKKHNINPPHIENHTLNRGLYFNLHNDALTLFIVNDLRNAYIHRDSPISGADKEELDIQINQEKRTLTRYNFFYSNKLINKRGLDNDFKNYLINESIDLSNADELDLLYYRIKWRVPAELNEILDYYHYPTLFTFGLPQKSHIELKREMLGNKSTFSYQEYKQKVLNIKTSSIKVISKIGYRKISIFNLSDCMWSLFDTLKRLLKAFLIKKLYNKEL